MIECHHSKTFRKGWFCFHTQQKSSGSSDRDVEINRGISSSITKGIYESRAERPYILRCISQFSAPLVSTLFHNTISLSRHEQVCLTRLRFERYFSHHG